VSRYTERVRRWVDDRDIERGRGRGEGRCDGCGGWGIR